MIASTTRMVKAQLGRALLRFRIHPLAAIARMACDGEVVFRNRGGVGLRRRSPQTAAADLSDMANVEACPSALPAIIYSNLTFNPTPAACRAAGPSACG